MKPSLSPACLRRLAEVAIQGPYFGVEAFDADIFLTAVAKHIAERAKFFSVRNFGSKYHRRMGIPHTKPSHFVDQLVREGDDIVGIGGIRFLGLNPAKPFLDLIPFYSDLGALAEAIPRLSNRLRDQFSLFEPRRTRVTFSDSAAKIVSQSIGLSTDMHTKVFAGSLRGNPNVTVGTQNGDVTDFYLRYRSEFERDLIARPYLKEHREVVRFEDLQRALSAQLLGLAKSVLGTAIGFVMLEPGNTLGLDGYTIREILVFEEHRNKGIGTALFNYAFSLAKLSNPQAAVFAQIHSSNRASLGAATSAGFSDFVTDYFVEKSAS